MKSKEKIDLCCQCEKQIGLGFTYCCGTPCLNKELKMNMKAPYDHHDCPCDSFCLECAKVYLQLDENNYLRCASCYTKKNHE